MSSTTSDRGLAWRGVYPVISCPFTDEDRLDRQVIDRELTFLYKSGARGVTVGMVSEILRLSDDERRELVETVCEANRGQGQVVIGIGSESSIQAVRRAQEAAACGADAVMAIPPMSSGAGLQTFDYYAAIADAVEVPVIVQDASSYVGVSMSIELQASLLERFGAEHIMYKPEAVPAGPRLSALLRATDGQARVFDGSGGIGVVEAYRRGAVGTMPGPEICWAMTKLWRALESDEHDTVYEIAPIVALLVSLQTSLDAFISIEKYLLAEQGVFASRRARSPVDFELDHVTRAEVDRLFALLARCCKPDDPGVSTWSS